MRVFLIGYFYPFPEIKRLKNHEIPVQHNTTKRHYGIQKRDRSAGRKTRLLQVL